jgi:hypothetical protein
MGLRKNKDADPAVSIKAHNQNAFFSILILSCNAL